LRHEISKRVWDTLILKILASRPDGEAATFEIARELAVLDSSARERASPSPPIDGGIFGAGFIASPRKGIWRITDAGRQYLRLADPRRGQSIAEAAPPLDVAAEAEIPDQDEAE